MPWCRRHRSCINRMNGLDCFIAIGGTHEKWVESSVFGPRQKVVCAMTTGVLSTRSSCNFAASWIAMHILLSLPELYTEFASKYITESTLSLRSRM